MLADGVEPRGWGEMDLGLGFNFIAGRRLEGA